MRVPALTKLFRSNSLYFPVIFPERSQDFLRNAYEMPFHTKIRIIYLEIMRILFERSGYMLAQDDTRTRIIRGSGTSFRPPPFYLVSSFIPQ